MIAAAAMAMIFTRSFFVLLPMVEITMGPKMITHTFLLFGN